MTRTIPSRCMLPIGIPVGIQWFWIPGFNYCYVQLFVFKNRTACFVSSIRFSIPSALYKPKERAIVSTSSVAFIPN